MRNTKIICHWGEGEGDLSQIKMLLLREGRRGQVKLTRCHKIIQFFIEGVPKASYVTTK